MVLGEDLSIMADGESLVFMCFFRWSICCNNCSQSQENTFQLNYFMLMDD